MTDRIEVGALQVDSELYNFINDEALPGTGISPEAFWSSYDSLLADLAPRNRELLDKRDELQATIDAWYQDHRDQALDLPAYKSFLQEIGYLVPEGGDFTVGTANVDAEISTIAGPQLVVPSPMHAIRSMRPTPGGAASTTRSMAPTRFPKRAGPSVLAATTRYAVRR